MSPWWWQRFAVHNTQSEKENQILTLHQIKALTLAKTVWISSIRVKQSESGP